MSNMYARLPQGFTDFFRITTVRFREGWTLTLQKGKGNIRVTFPALLRQD